MNDLERTEIRRQIEKLNEIRNSLHSMAYNCASIGLDTLSKNMSEQASQCGFMVRSLEFLMQPGNSVIAKANAKPKKVKNQPVA